jgi:hypothetical protein
VILGTVTNMYGNYGPGSTVPGVQPQPPTPGRPPRGLRGRAKIAAAVVTCGVVAAGAFAVTELVSGPTQTANTASSGTAAAASAGPTGQAAVLNDALTAASTTSTSTGSSTTTSTAAKGRLGRALIRLRLLGGMYGQYTFETKKGPRTLAFERGTILSIVGSDVTVRATDGNTQTWVLTSASIVREDGTRTSASSLADGQLVLAAGPISGTTRDARLVVIRSAAKKQA